MTGGEIRDTSFLYSFIMLREPMRQSIRVIILSEEEEEK